MTKTRWPLIGLAILACHSVAQAADETGAPSETPATTPAATPADTSAAAPAASSPQPPAPPPALPWRQKAAAPIRLGDWLADSLQQLAPRPDTVPQPKADAARKARQQPVPYEAGLMWLSGDELPAQRALARQVQDAVRQQHARGKLAEQSAGALSAFLATLPVTGRIPVPEQDPRVLQAHPELDPMASAGDELVAPPRPDTVTVVRDDGQRCELTFQPGARTADYLARCTTAGDASLRSPAIDQAWLVQPDGRITTVGVAAWNLAPNPPPAPGAWIWAPGRAADWPQRSNQLIAELLATQGPSGVDSITRPRPAAAPLRPPPPQQAQPRDLALSAGDWGITGLLQTPTARTPRAGHVGVTVSRTWPYTNMTATLSPFDSLEVGMRYTNITNIPYGPEAFSGKQSYKDKSLDVKWTLLQEDATWPQLAVGLRDPGGTGLFAGEYLVGSKRHGNLDFSLGLGWGYLGARGNLRNPLSVFGSRFSQRGAVEIGSGGTAHFNTLFTGRTALFGGVQWHTPWEPLLLKVELDGNNYQHEPFGNNQDARWPVNVGLVWRLGEFTVSAGVERGNKLSFGVGVNIGLNELGLSKFDLPKRVPVDDAYLQRRAEQTDQARTAMAATTPAGTPAATTTVAAESDADAPPTGAPAAQLLAELSAHTGWSAVALSRNGRQWVVQFDQAGGYYMQEQIDRGVAVLHRSAPASVDGFRFVLSTRQVPVRQFEIDRAAWVIERTRWIPPGRQVEVQRVADDKTLPPPIDAAALPRLPRSVNLGLQQNIGGPDGYLYALSLRGGGQMRLWHGGWAQASVDFRLIDNYNHFRADAPSALPRVRTYLREYLTTSRLTLPNLQVNQFARLDDNTFGLVYAGLLESMFAGVGGEVLWRPPASSWGIGLDLNFVRQRGFEQHLALRDYRVTTGHVTVHWDTGWKDVLVEGSAGQYLAGDRGATLDLSRVFDNGARIGAWLTKTNVSSAQFGEGSFDKGIYLTVPFDAFLGTWSGQTAGVAWQPLIRDGGARLQRAQTLWGLTQSRDRQALRYRSAVTGD